MDNQNKTKFNQWGQLFRCKTLTGNQRVILGIILNFHNIDGWDFTPLSVLKENSGFTKPTVIKNVNVLVKKGLLKKSKNKSRQTNGTPPNDYIPNYDIILNLLKSQESNFFTLNPQEELKNFTLSEQEESNFFTPKELKNFTQEEKKKRKNKAIIYSNYNDSTRRYMVYPENENNQITNTDMKNQITNNPKNGQPINDLHVFDFSDRGWDNPKDEETTCEYATTRIVKTNPKTDEYNHEAAGATEIAHSEVLSMQVDSYPTHAEKTPQEQNKEGNGTGDKTAADNNNTKTTDTNTDSPNSDVLGFNEADLGDGDSPTATEETATESDKSQDTEANPTTTNIQEAQINGRDEVLMSSVDSYSTETEKTPQGRNKEGNLEMDTAAEGTHSPNNGENTAPTNNTLSMEETQRIMIQAAQTVMKNRKHAATNIQNAQKNDRGEEITPQADNYTTEAEKTPQGAKNSGVSADTAATEHGEDTAAAKPIFNTIRTAAEWKVRHGNDSCWEETFEHAVEGLETPLEAEIRTLLNQVYKDWQNHTAAINTKMINDMKVYAERRYGIILTSNKKKDTVNYCIPRHDAVPTAEETEKLDLCHISNNRDILNRLSAGCKQVNTVILALNKAIEFTQIYRIATAQSYECVSNAMATIDQNPAMSDKKAKYITDLATHLCDMLEKVC